MAWHEGIPVSKRDQSRPDLSLSAAVARLTDRVDQQQQKIHQQQQTIKTLSARLEWAQQREQLLLRRLAMQRTRRRHRPDPAQLALPFDPGEGRL